MDLRALAPTVQCKSSGCTSLPVKTHLLRLSRRCMCKLPELQRRQHRSGDRCADPGLQEESRVVASFLALDENVRLRVSEEVSGLSAISRAVVHMHRRLVFAEGSRSRCQSLRTWLPSSLEMSNLYIVSQELQVFSVTSRLYSCRSMFEVVRCGSIHIRAWT